MRVIASILFVALGLPGLLGGCGADSKTRPPNDSGPWIEFDESAHDFGSLYASERRDHTFRVKNRGAEALKIRDVKIECGCLTPVFSKTTIEPGGIAEMRVSFHPPAEGPIRKKIWVYSNDLYRLESVLEITAHGLGQAQLLPAVIDFSGELPLDGVVREATLTLPPGETFVEVRLVGRSPCLHATVERPLLGREAKLRLELKGLHEKTRLRERIEVIVAADAAGKRKDFSLPFGWQATGEVRPAVTVDPPALHFGAVRGGTTVSRQVTLAGRRVESLVVRDFGEATVADLGAGAFRIDLKAPIGARRLAGFARAELEGGGVVDIPLLGATLP